MQRGARLESPAWCHLALLQLPLWAWGRGQWGSSWFPVLGRRRPHRPLVAVLRGASTKYPEGSSLSLLWTRPPPSPLTPHLCPQVLASARLVPTSPISAGKNVLSAFDLDPMYPAVGRLWDRLLSHNLIPWRSSQVASRTNSSVGVRAAEQSIRHSVLEGHLADSSFYHK